MKRDLIYLTLLAALFAAAKVMAQNDGATSRQGLTPRTIEVGFTKTVHILFPASVTYIDIGSMAIIAGKADGAENVVRVKAAVRDFAEETNLTVITEDGGFYTFDARYAENPARRPSRLRPRRVRRHTLHQPWERPVRTRGAYCSARSDGNALPL